MHMVMDFDKSRLAVSSEESLSQGHHDSSRFIGWVPFLLRQNRWIESREAERMECFLVACQHIGDREDMGPRNVGSRILSAVVRSVSTVWSD